MKGTNNLEPIYIQCEKDIDAITEDALKAIEGAMILMLNISHTSMNKSPGETLIVERLHASVCMRVVL